MDSSSSHGFGKLLPKSIQAKRRRSKASSTASNDDADAHNGGTARRSAAGSDATSISGSMTSNNSTEKIFNSDLEP
jgi:hypothetical protein